VAKTVDVTTTAKNTRKAAPAQRKKVVNTATDMPLQPSKTIATAGAPSTKKGITPSAKGTPGAGKLLSKNVSHASAPDENHPPTQDFPPVAIKESRAPGKK
jgi:hypothetical protein